MTGAPEVPEIRTDRLLLRGFGPGDVDAWHRAVFSDPEVMRYLPSGKPVPRSRTEEVLNSFVAHWDRHGFGPWAVVLSDERRLVGHCGLRHLPDSTEVELLYGLARDCWGRGLATEAARASLAFGFDRAGLDRIVALAVPANTASTTVMQKVGMTFEGEAHMFGLDLVRYEIAREDFPPDGGRGPEGE